MLKVDGNYVGQVISFVYNGGSSVGKRRLVSVTKADNRTIMGDDLEVKSGSQYRNYKMSLISDVKVVATAAEKVVPMSDIVSGNAKVSHLSDAQMLELYGLLNPNPGKGLKYNREHNVFIEKNDNLPRVELRLEEASTVLAFYNYDGKTLELLFNNTDTAKTITMPTTRVCSLSGDSMAEFATKLIGHVGVTAAVPVPETDLKKGGYIDTAVNGWDEIYKTKHRKPTLTCE